MGKYVRMEHRLKIGTRIEFLWSYYFPMLGIPIPKYAQGIICDIELGSEYRLYVIEIEMIIGGILTSYKVNYSSRWQTRMPFKIVRPPIPEIEKPTDFDDCRI